jgi:hypothetical protein
MAGVRAGTGSSIPADGGYYVLDAVVVRRRVYRSGTVTRTVAGGAGAAPMRRVVARRWRNGMTAATSRGGRCRRRSHGCQSGGNGAHLG